VKHFTRQRHYVLQLPHFDRPFLKNYKILHVYMYIKVKLIKQNIALNYFKFNIRVRTVCMTYVISNNKHWHRCVKLELFTCLCRRKLININTDEFGCKTNIILKRMEIALRCRYRHSKANET